MTQYRNLEPWLSQLFSALVATADAVHALRASMPDDTDLAEFEAGLRQTADAIEEMLSNITKKE